jgi:hypothetical protein
MNNDLRMNLCAVWGRTPRAAFAVNEENVNVCYTDPPIRGVQVHTLTFTPFLTSKARGVQRGASCA